MNQTRVGLHRILDEARLELEQALYGLPEQEMASSVLGDWSIKDLLAHVAFWEEIAIPDFQRVARGHRPALAQFHPENVDVWNGLAMEMRHDFPCEQVLFELSVVRDAMKASIDALPDGALTTGWAPTYCAISAQHDREHANQIREWRERRGV